MISIIGCLFEAKKEDSTKLSTGEKLAGQTAIAGGLGAGFAGHFYNSSGGTDEGRHAAKKVGEAIGDVGLGTAAVAGGALAAHKLYKMYKNKKK